MSLVPFVLGLCKGGLVENDSETAWHQDGEARPRRVRSYIGRKLSTRVVCFLFSGESEVTDHMRVESPREILEKMDASVNDPKFKPVSGICGGTAKWEACPQSCPNGSMAHEKCLPTEKERSGSVNLCTFPLSELLFSPVKSIVLRSPGQPFYPKWVSHYMLTGCLTWGLHSALASVFGNFLDRTGAAECEEPSIPCPVSARSLALSDLESCLLEFMAAWPNRNAS